MKMISAKNLATHLSANRMIARTLLPYFFITSAFLSSTLLSSTGGAAIFDSCQVTEQARLALTVHGSNILNASTTRTPEGGPYKVKTLLCSKTCQVKQQLKIRNEYRPGHPDANEEGYILSPDIDKAKEIEAVNAYALVLRSAAAKCTRAKIVDNGSSVSVSYPGSDTLIDIFNFNKQEIKSDGQKVVSWIHIDRKGAEQIFNF